MHAVQCGCLVEDRPFIPFHSFRRPIPRTHPPIEMHAWGSIISGPPSSVPPFSTPATLPPGRRRPPHQTRNPQSLAQRHSARLIFLLLLLLPFLFSPSPFVAATTHTAPHGLSSPSCSRRQQRSPSVPFFPTSPSHPRTWFDLVPIVAASILFSFPSLSPTGQHTLRLSTRNTPSFGNRPDVFCRSIIPFAL